MSTIDIILPQPRQDVKAAAGAGEAVRKYGKCPQFLLGHSSLTDSTPPAIPIAPDGKFRAGIGGRYAVSPKCDLYAEVQLYTRERLTRYQWLGEVPAIYEWGGSGVVIDHVHIGARFALGS